MASILVLNGPNLNLLGEREPEVYGSRTLEEINRTLILEAKSLGHEIQALQSNAEHVLVDRIHAAREDGTRFIIINPGAYTHTSIALRDALLGVGVPFVVGHVCR